MRETILVALGAGGVGAAVGACAVLASHDPEKGPSAPAIDERVLAAAFESAFSKGVADLRRDVAGLRDALAQPRASGSGDAADAPAPRRAASATEGLDDARGAARRRGAASADADRESPFESPGPHPNFARLRKMHGWDERTELRRNWLFADEATCLAWFGTPDELSHDGTWFYREPKPDADGDGESDGNVQFTIQFHAGRVHRIDAPDPEEK